MERKIEEQLLAWKNKTDDRLPLIVNGARQVGSLKMWSISIWRQI